MKKTRVRHLPTNRCQPVSGLVPVDRRKMREAFAERMRLEIEFIEAATTVVRELQSF